MRKSVTCACGEVMRSDTDDELVALVGKHAREVHDQEEEPSREQVLAMAQPE